MVVYLDNVIIYLKDEKEHPGHVHKVLEVLMEAGLYVKLVKCNFHSQEINFLGYIITPNGIKMEDS